MSRKEASSWEVEARRVVGASLLGRVREIRIVGGGKGLNAWVAMRAEKSCMSAREAARRMVEFIMVGCDGRRREGPR